MIFFNKAHNISCLLFSLLFLVTHTVIASGLQINDSTIQYRDSMATHHDFVSCGMNVRTIRTTPEINPGLITSFDQAIAGKIAGVQISTINGSIQSGSNILIHGISSLVNSDQPLYEIDGIALEPAYTSSNLASILNPDDIQSISILEDAAANGIYGMRASGGVISITTKKGQTDKLRINFSSTNAVQQVSKTVDVLSAADFRNLINTKGSNAEKALLGNASTNWSNEIFQTALATDNHISISGGLAKNIPFRISLGYLNEDGILKTEHLDRISGSVVINPSFFHNHLNISVNLRGISNNNQIANINAIGNAFGINPTVPVKSDETVYSNNFGGYWQSFSLYNGNIEANSLAPKNPVALLYQNDHNLKSLDYFATIGIDYKFHFFPDLHVYMNYANYYTDLNENSTISTNSPEYFAHGFIMNRTQQMKIENTQFGFKYNKSFKKHTVAASVNYESDIYQSSYQYSSVGIDGYNPISQTLKSPTYLSSLFCQIKYNYDEKYYLIVNSRVDGSSRFSMSNRWDNAPSIGFAWNATEESFMKDQSINLLKARISYGSSGQQPYNNTSTVYNQNLKWEATKTLNYGIDFGIHNNRITGSIDFYNRTTDDLLNYVSVPSGTNFNQTILVNKGTLNCNGGELTINAIPVMTNKIVWSISLNASYQQSILDNYSTNGYSIPIDFSGNISLLNKDGYAPAMFYVLKQKYDSNGKPIEGSYFDLNADGKIDYNDRYAYHSAAPDCLLGLSSLLTFGKWSTGLSFRANIGNYVYNETNAILGCYQQQTNLGYLRNLSSDYVNTGFKTQHPESDYYVENASFIKMDYLNVGYDFGEIAKKIRLKLSTTVQNVLTITGYKGVDPEMPGGVENGFYPRPRIFSVKMNLDF